jgi:hypothetical protein
MNLKSGILSLLTSALVGTVLFGAAAASAGDWADMRRGNDSERRDDRRDDDRRGGSPSLISVHVHGPSCHHAPAPAPRPDGRYELRTTQRWVSGYQDRVWVPEVCHTKEKRHSRKTVCRGGYYDTRYVEGHYEPVEEWVWVANPPRHEHHRSGPSIQVTARF